MLNNLTWGKFTEAITRGKQACNYYATNLSAFMMIRDSRDSESYIL